MGCGASSLTQAPENFDHFCVTFHWVDTVRLIHATPRTIALIRKALQHYWKGGISEQTWFYGALDMELSGRPFVKGAGKEETFMSMKAICHMLEYLKADGWTLARSSDMSRTIDLTSWFLKRDPGGPPGGKPAAICSLSLSNTDSLQLARAPRPLFEALKQAIEATYTKGIQGDSSLGEGDYLIKLHGNPWTSEEEEGMDSRKFLLELIRRWQALQYFIYGTANLKGTADSIFFIHHPDGNEGSKPAEYCMLSLNQRDRFRLIDCPEKLYPVVRECIIKYRGKEGLQKESEVHGTHEFKLRGTPWAAEAQDVVYARLFVAKVLEALYPHGWGSCLTVDMSRKMNDKAVIVLKSVTPKEAPHFCLAPCEMDKLRVMGSPPDIINTIRDHLNLHWPIGIQSETPDYYGSHEFKLKGQPWSGRQGSEELHIRSFFCFLIKKLSEIGWEAVASCDVSAKHIRTETGPDYPIDVHTWFFAKLN